MRCRRWLAFAAALAPSACTDPVLETKLDALGPEPGPYAPGPNHRAGAPCTVCHAEGSSARSAFDLGGTVYARASSKEGLPGVKVRLFDSEGDQLGVITNQVGNFFLREGELGAVDFPVWVELEYQGELTAMQSPMFRERSCATCHSDPPGPSHAGHVYLWDDP